MIRTLGIRENCCCKAFKLTWIGLIVALVSQVSLAKEGTVQHAVLPVEKRFFVGPEIGVSAVNNAVGAGMGYGINSGFFPSEHFGLGLFWIPGRHPNDISTSFLGAEALYRFTGNTTGLHMGAKVGLGKFTMGDATGKSSMAYGVKTAYDYSLLGISPITAGAELDMLFVKPSEVTYTILTPMITFKYWF